MKLFRYLHSQAILAWSLDPFEPGQFRSATKARVVFFSAYMAFFALASALLIGVAFLAA